MIKVVCVGKIKEKFYSDAMLEYLKRLQSFTKIEIKEVSEVNSDSIDKTLLKEGKNILSQIKDDEFVITLEIEGELLSSPSLAKLVEDKLTRGASTITFVIGGSNGLSDEVKNRSNYHLSFGKITLPHQLARVVLVEQIYRAFTIINNHKYHK